MGKRKSKRLVVVSDFHCNHRSGLTPPDWQWDAEDSNEYRAKWGAVQRQLWGYFRETISGLRPDILVVNGDAVDGGGSRSGGSERICSEQNEEVLMAAECIRVARADKVFMTYGTPYHTGVQYDVESLVAHAVGAEIEAEAVLDVNGVVFNFRHKVGASSVPHGRHTAVSRERMWNLLWATRDQAPQAEVIVRSHVHYFNFCGGPGWLAMTTPALQGLGSKYGQRACSGVVDFGMIHFDIRPSGEYSWKPHIVVLSSQSRRATKL